MGGTFSIPEVSIYLRDTFLFSFQVKEKSYHYVGLSVGGNASPTLPLHKTGRLTWNANLVI